jgi:hypothetical protein
MEKTSTVQKIALKYCEFEPQRREAEEFEVGHGRIRSVCCPFWASKYNGNMKGDVVVVLTTHITKIILLL